MSPRGLGFRPALLFISKQGAPFSPEENTKRPPPWTWQRPKAAHGSGQRLPRSKQLIWESNIHFLSSHFLPPIFGEHNRPFQQELRLPLPNALICNHWGSAVPASKRSGLERSRSVGKDSREEVRWRGWDPNQRQLVNRDTVFATSPLPSSCIMGNDSREICFFVQSSTHYIWFFAVCNWPISWLK